MLPMLWLPAELILVCICDRSANMCARLVCVSKAVRLHLLQTARDSNIHLRLLVPARPTNLAELCGGEIYICTGTR